jgi:hypothetical protein
MGTGDFTFGALTNCLAGGGGNGFDCPTGLDGNGVRYDTPTWYGFSASAGEYENMEWDVAVKYAADWGNFKVSAAYGFAENTDPGCTGPGACSFVANVGGGGAPFQNFHKDVTSNQVGASVMHVPTGLWVYGEFENADNQGTKFLRATPDNIGSPFEGNGGGTGSSNANNTDAWFVKAGIKRTWTPLGATVIWGEGGQYRDMFADLCLQTGSFSGAGGPGNACVADIPTALGGNGTNITSDVSIKDSTVNRWGAGIVQEIDAAAMHIFFRWEHLDVNLSATCLEEFCAVGTGSHLNFVQEGQRVHTSFDGLDMFQVGGVIFF